MSDHSAYLASRYEAEKNDPPVPITRSSPCSDCAVTHGLYTEISDALLTMPEPVKTGFSERWDCHNGGRCMGHWLRLRKLR